MRFSLICFATIGNSDWHFVNYVLTLSNVFLDYVKSLSPWKRDNLVEQVRPLLQAEDIRVLTGGEVGLLEARDSGFFSVEMPEFWHRPELSGYLRDVRLKPGKYDWLGDGGLTLAPTKLSNPTSLA